MKSYYFFTLLLAAVIQSISVKQLEAQNLVRGPYLQSPGPTSMIVCWRTDTTSDSRVYYGENFGSMTLFVDGTSATEHRVKITGLSPKTKYYYTVGSNTQTLRGDTLMHFTTAPDPLTPGPVRLWAMGDFGHGNAGQALVRDSYQSFAESDRPADLWLWLGDNVYQDGTDDEFQTKVFDSIYGYKRIFMNLPFAGAPGNHDYNSICAWQDPCNKDPYTHTGPYLDLIEPPTEGEQGGVPSHLKLYYSFDYGDIHFISLNSELGSLTPAYNWVGLFDNDTAFTSPMIEWLKADLAATTKKWKIAFWHQCPYSGQDNFTESSSFQFFTYATRKHFNPIIERMGVDLVLTGHDHNYQRSYLINGLYDFKATFTPDMIINGSSGNNLLGEPYIKYTDGPLAGKGTVYVVAGNTSNCNSYSPIEHPVIYWGQACDTCLGSFIVDVDGDRLDGRYITAYGETLDQFTILKQSTTGIEEQPSVFGNAFIHPNPFSGKTSLTYTLAKKGEVKISVLDLAKKEIYSLNPGIRDQGKYSEVLNMEEAGLASGTYLIRLECNGAVKYLKAIKAD